MWEKVHLLYFTEEAFFDLSLCKGKGQRQHEHLDLDSIAKQISILQIRRSKKVDCLNHTIISKSLHHDLHLGKLIAVVLLRGSLAGRFHICLDKALSGRGSLQLLQAVPPLSFRQIYPTEHHTI